MAEMPKSPRFPPTPRRIEVLAFEQVQLLDVAGPLQVCSTFPIQSTPRATMPQPVRWRIASIDAIMVHLRRPTPPMMGDRNAFRQP